MILIDRKYIGFLSNRLERFTRKSDKLYNCRCPLCGDSKTNKIKTRGYFHEKKGRLLYYCHNCGASMTLGSFLKNIDPNLYAEYTQELFIEKNGTPSTQTFVPDITKFSNPVVQRNVELSRLKKISSLEPNHPAKLYVTKRLIPSETHYKLFYAPRFKEWVNSIIPEKFAAGVDEPRLVLPFLDKNKKCFGFQGRALGPSNVRYITIMLDDSKPKVFGLDSVDLSKRTYITEGPIDSLFLPNAIAMAGADVSTSWVEEKYQDNLVFVYDNEPRNTEIIKRIKKIVSAGFKVVVWPSNINEKDINDMVISGRSPTMLRDIIDSNTYSGLAAEFALSQWSRV